MHVTDDIILIIMLLNNYIALFRGVVYGWAVSAAACHAGDPGLIPGPGQTYV
jgi:hypothetical protein